MSSEKKQTVRLTAEEFKYIALLHEFSDAYVYDCIIDEGNNRVIYLVDPKDIGKAIGYRGTVVQTLKKMLNKDVEIIGYSDKLEDQVKLSLAPARVREVKIVDKPGGRKVVYAIVDPADKAIAIGKNGKTVNRAQLVLKRYFNIDKITIL